jgi:hypothetical protein
MFSRKTAGGVSVLLAASMLLAACTPTASTPTVDPNVIYTAAAQTVSAKLTAAATLTPPATNTPPATATPIPPTATITLPPVTNTPAVTSTPVKIAAADKAEFVSQSVADGTKVKRNAEFSMTWTLKNPGPTTWKGVYSFRYYVGDVVGVPRSISFGKDIKPGEQIDLRVTLKAPDRDGNFASRWVLTNDQGLNFYDVYLKVVVGDSAASVTPGGPTATITETPEPTDTEGTETPTVTPASSSTPSASSTPVPPSATPTSST